MDKTTANMETFLSNATESSSNIISASTTITDQVTKIIYIIISSLGITGNFMVVFVLLKFSKVRQKISVLYIVHQSIIDFLVSIFLLLSTVIQNDDRVFVSVADDIYCRVWLRRSPLWITILVSTYNLVLLTIERYLSVVHPIKHKMSFTHNKAVISIVLCWLLGITFNLTTTLPYAKVTDGHCELFISRGKTFDIVSGVGIITVLYFIPITTLVFCYGRMAYSLHMKI